MLDVIDQIRELSQKGTRFAVCTVINTWRSSPRPVGSSLLVTETGEMYGSVSGGCVENAAVAKALKVLESGVPEIVNFGVADEEAWEIGLSCGGAIEVLITPFFGGDGSGKEIWKKLDAHILENRSTALIQSLSNGSTYLLNEGSPIEEQARTLLSKRMNGKVEYEGEGYFVQVFPIKAKMILIGSAHISVELIELASLFGFETIVIDPRDTFAKKTGYKVDPSSILADWPQEVLPDMVLDQDTYIVILSHDPKIDDEALKIVLRKPVRYIGALGSRKTHAKRITRLENYGFNEEEIARIQSPIGVDIGSQSAGEIALSIMAEAVKYKNVDN